ncbi:MAG: MopE-related protein, partial [Nitrospinota bacterium]
MPVVILNIVYKRESWLFNANVYEPRFNSSTNVSACTGDGRSAYDIGGGYGFYVYQFNSKTKTVEYKCNGTVTEDIRGFSGYNYAFGLKDPCHTNTWIVNTCTPTETIAMTWTIECQDNDSDGYYAYDSVTCPEGNDCNNNDPAINPGASEICDGKDNNCNGEIDEGACSCSLNVTLNSSANIANGNLSHSQTLNGNGQRSTNTVLSDFTLYYNSLYSNSGYLGTGWTHSYDIRLKGFADGSVLLREGNDRRLYI